MWKTLTRYGIVSDRLYEVVMVGWSLDLSDLASNRRRWPGCSLGSVWFLPLEGIVPPLLSYRRSLT